MKKSKATQERIIIAAVEVAGRYGLSTITRAAVAKQAAVSDSLVSVYYGTSAQLQRATLRRAIKDGHMGVIGQALAAPSRNVAHKLPDEVKRQAAATLIG